MLPSSATTTPWMPVSSATSRIAVCSEVSRWFGGADQGGAALYAWAVGTVDDEAARGGLLDCAHAWSRRVSGRTSAPGLAASTVRAIGRGHQAILIDAGGATVHSPAYG